MARLVDMPKLSPTMEEGQIVSWHKKEGDKVEVDELLAEVETDKATMEFRSFDKGTLLKILSGAGTVVKLGDPVAIIGEPGEKIDELVAKAKGGGAPTATPTATPGPSGPVPVPAPVPVPDGSGRVKASPFVRKVARERGIDLHGVSGSGPGGRIVARDLDAPRAPSAAPSRTVSGTGTGTGARTRVVATAADLDPIKKPLSMMRRTIARRLTESKQQVPHFYLTIDVDAAPLVALRTQFNGDLGTKVSFNDLVVKAAAVAIGRAPEVNASFTPEALVYHRRVDISVAVAVEDGLVTPVVRGADRKSVLDIAEEMRALAHKAKDKKLTPDEMSNGTFSISNLGMFGIDAFAAVINPPEGAILAVGAIRAEPVVQGDAVVPGKRLALTLSCDHRVVDGAVGAKFLAELRQVLEHPMQILAL
jgi:pyruvate dehydrogenase E2 component (dihydrolipoamide acetyltransferase)